VIKSKDIAMAIEWSEAYATTIDSIDRQHKKLFEYINKLENCILEGMYVGSKIDDILEFLGTYTKVHFSHEEFCMKENGCPTAEKNIKAHESFLEFYTDFVKSYKEASADAEKEKLIRRLQKMAEDWLVNHICKIDIHLKACVK